MKGDVRIETMSGEEVAKLVAGYDPRKDYRKGMFVDCFDERAWRISIVTKDDDGMISIHYEGWSPKFDEAQLKLPTPKIAPFRSKSTGYTGQVKQAYRQFKYEKAERERIERELKLILSQAFIISDPVRYTQFVRGEAFIYVDSLLNMLQVIPPKKEEVKEVMEFLRFVLQFIVEWVKAAGDLSHEFDAADRFDLLYLVHPRTAVAMTHPEIEYTLGTFLGMCKRSLATFKIIEIDTVPPESIDVSDESDPDERARKWCATLFYLTFKSLSGVKEIHNVVKDERQILKLACKLLGALAYVFGKVSDPELDRSAAEMAESLSIRLNSGNERDTKDIDRMGARGFFADVDALLARSQRISKKDLKAAVESRLLVDCLKSENFMRKVEGLEIFKENYGISAMCI